MKLRNKKTGEIRELPDGFFCGDNLKKICEEWEDYEELKGSALDLMILTLTDFIENEPDEDKVDLKDCKQMLDKLKAWKRLKDKGFSFHGYDDGYDHNFNSGHIEFYVENSGDVLGPLDLLFGGEE